MNESTIFRFTNRDIPEFELSGNLTYADVWRTLEEKADPFILSTVLFYSIAVDFKSNWLKPFPMGGIATVFANELYRTPRDLSEFVISAGGGIDNISALKPCGSLRSGSWIGTVNASLNLFDDQQKLTYLRGLETERSGAISSDDYYLYYSQKWLKMLAYAVGMKPVDVLAILKSDDPRSNMTLIYLMFGDLVGLSDGFRPKESELSTIGRLWFSRQQAITKAVTDGTATLAPEQVTPISTYLKENGCRFMARVLVSPIVAEVSAFLTLILAVRDTAFTPIEDKYEASMTKLYASNVAIRDVVLNHVSVYPRNRDSFPVITSMNGRQYGNNGQDLEKLGLVAGTKIGDVVVFIMGAILVHPDQDI